MVKPTKDTREVTEASTEVSKEIEEQVGRLFMDYINKSRNLYQKIYVNDPHSVDSDVSIITHTMMGEFDKYRTRREE